MNSEPLDELMVYAGLTVYALGDRSVVLTDTDKEIAVSMLKRTVDQRSDMNAIQKERLKNLLDICSRLQ